ncbi:peptidase [Sphingomonas sp. MMS12-HWE2-04]|uniref:peptidase n=1 Tax=Sphingomonas sp. MMS12-HWE2-04 TaxID=3234199 RepID=UPI00384C31BC
MLRLCSALARLAYLALAWLLRLPGRAAVELGAPGDGMPARPRRLLVALLVVAPIYVLAGWLLPLLTLVMSPSIDAWVVRAAPGPIRKGDLVQFTLLHPVAGPKPVSVTKYVMCVAGERLSLVEHPSPTVAGLKEGSYFCDGKFLGRTVALTARGAPLPHSLWQGVIPEGQAYVGSLHPRGFDSRYLGLVPVNRLHRMVKLF